MLLATSGFPAYINVLLSSSFLGIFLITGFVTRDKGKKLLLIVSIIMLVFISCSEQIVTPEESDVVDFSTTVSNLESNKTYFWKIVASPQNSNDFTSESLIRSFTIVN